MTYYEILGVGQNATIDEITAARDKLKGRGPNGPKDRVPFSRWPQIDEAYSVLSNPIKRQEYDTTLVKPQQERSQKSASRPVGPTTPSPTGPTASRPVGPTTPRPTGPTASRPAGPTTPRPAGSTTPRPTGPTASRPAGPTTPRPAGSTTPRPTGPTASRPAGPTAPTPTEPTPTESTTNKEEFNLGKDDLYVSRQSKIKPKTEDTLSKLKQVAAGGLGFVIGNIPGAIILPMIVRSKNKKYKLYKHKGPIIIKGMNDREINAISAHCMELDNEINRLLSEPHNSYRLEVSAARYNAQIELLKGILGNALNKKSKGLFDAFKDKVRIITIKNRIRILENKIEKINSKIATYESTLDKPLRNKNKEIVSINNQIEATKDKLHIKKLNLKKNSIIKRRKFNAGVTKFFLVKSGEFYDSILSAYAFITSIPEFFKKTDNIDLGDLALLPGMPVVEETDESSKRL